MRKSNEKFEFELGVKAKDCITGFTGTITGMVRYLTGCDQYLITPMVDKEGKHVEGRWYDSNRIEVVKFEKAKVRDQDNGGAMDTPPNY